MNTAIGLDTERAEIKLRVPKNVKEYLAREAQKDNRSVNNYLIQIIYRDMGDKEFGVDKILRT